MRTRFKVCSSKSFDNADVDTAILKKNACSFWHVDRRDSVGFPNRIRLDVYTDDILFFCERHISAGTFRFRKVVTGMLTEPAYPVIKGTWDNVVIQTPLSVRQAAFAALYDKRVNLIII